MSSNGDEYTSPRVVDLDVRDAVYASPKSPLKLSPNSALRKFDNVTEAFEERGLPTELIMMITQDYRGAEVPPSNASQVYNYYGPDKVDYIIKFDVANIIAPPEYYEKSVIVIYTDSNFDSVEDTTDHPDLDHGEFMRRAFEGNATDVFIAASTQNPDRILLYRSEMFIHPNDEHRDKRLRPDFLMTVDVRMLEYIVEHRAEFSKKDPEHEQIFVNALITKYFIMGELDEAYNILDTLTEQYRRWAYDNIYTSLIECKCSLEFILQVLKRQKRKQRSKHIPIILAVSYYAGRKDIIEYFSREDLIRKFDRGFMERLTVSERIKHAPEFHETMSQDMVDIIFIFLDNGVELPISWYDGIRDLTLPHVQNFVRRYIEYHKMRPRGLIFNAVMKHIHSDGLGSEDDDVMIDYKNYCLEEIPLGCLSPAVMYWILETEIPHKSIVSRISGYIEAVTAESINPIIRQRTILDGERKVIMDLRRRQDSGSEDRW